MATKYKNVERTQRLSAQRFTIAYRTTSVETVMVLAGMIQFALVAEHAAILRAAKTSNPALIRETHRKS